MGVVISHSSVPGCGCGCVGNPKERDKGAGVGGL